MALGRVSRAVSPMDEVAENLEVASKWKYTGTDGTLKWNFKTRDRSGCIRIQAAHTPEQTNEWIQKYVLNLHVKELGYDLEYKPNFVKGGKERKTSLLQISAGDEVLLVQLLHMNPRQVPSLLKEVLLDRSIRKAGVGIYGDIKKFYHDWNVRTEGAVDLAIELNRRGQGPHDLSLAKVAATVLGVDMCKRKQVTMSNWELRYLSAPQMLYAALDAWVGRRGIGRRAALQS